MILKGGKWFLMYVENIVIIIINISVEFFAINKNYQAFFFWGNEKLIIF